ncbi:putative transcription factor MADS-type1 family [Arabidopsis thaliana]|uniref:AGAMOUS-like 48 n=3 Tax=Arabidopsis TaxID=3701 RepID=Q9XEF1_ARATH|nr:AGAMOUS-like 48 [Arabidopsis thaliana]AAD25936.1 hypothetical protein [Arabidopsis thaliana]AEC09797.1 AGAMOUS-like 48 [Arabidopsis thaliana]KAG7639166.1 Transcription factor MADS-box [Arabidopsis thaliana x Arabidopsis arenosa]OAP07621.1 AGL48 [Arabidopsis thaliana]|eukprot:NP_181550.1 AGAMOUS-like 48 [Arabidopsis thaliana]
MTRKKVKLVWIENDKSRATSLQKMRVGLLKKVKELTILCAVRAIVIIFSPDKVGPLVWPSPQATHGLLDEFFALPKSVQKKKESNVESYLKEKTHKFQEQLKKSKKKNKEHVIDELMMQLQSGREIADLNQSEMYALLSFSRDTILLCRKKLAFMQFPPLRDPPVFPFEIQVEEFKTTTNDGFVGGGQDNKRAGRTDEATRFINTDIFKQSKSYYFFDEWVFPPSPPKYEIPQQMENGNPNPKSYRLYQGSSSNGNPHLEMDPFRLQMMTSQGLAGSVSQPLQHHSMINNPTMAMNQPSQDPFDYMRSELGINEGININNSQFYMSNNTITANDGVRQEPYPNVTTAGENNGDATTSNTNMVWPGFNNHHF